MFTMVYEQAHPPTMATCSEERSQFLATQLPPEGWHVWFGQCDDQERSRLHTLHSGFRLDMPLIDECNTQLTYGAPGNLSFLTFSSRSQRVTTQATAELGTLARSFGLVRVWPPTSVIELDRPSREMRWGDGRRLMDTATLHLYRAIGAI